MTALRAIREMPRSQAGTFRWLTILIALTMAGCGNEEQSVVVGGHALRLRLEGHGSPTVVFESGAGEGLETWAKVQPRVARFSRTIAYDRAGLGKSGPGPEPRDARRIAHELHTALRKVGAEPPYILVGHSSGAFYIRYFADSYPEEIVGLVFVDPATEQLNDWLENHAPQSLKNSVASSRMPPGVRAEAQAHLLTEEQIRGLSSPVHLPARVLSSTRPEQNHLPGFIEAVLNSHVELVNNLPKSKHIVTDKSGHNIQQEEPGLVVVAIHEIVDQIRQAKP